MTTDEAGDVLLVAIVDMAGGATEAGQRYEDFVLELLARHGGALERRTRTDDAATEVHLIRFRDRAGYSSFLADPDRQDYRERIGPAAPTTRVIEVRDVR
jgi:hypothetical protein